MSKWRLENKTGKVFDKDVKMMKKKGFVWLVALALVLVATGLIYMQDLVRSKEYELVRLRGDVELLRSAYLDLSGTHVVSQCTDIRVKDRAGDSLLLRSVASDGPRLGLYISRSQCEPCWEEALARLERLMREEKLAAAPFVLADSYNPREFKLLRQRHKSPVPFYSVGREFAIEHLTRPNSPFYFILYPDGTWSSVFYADGLYGLLGDDYFRMAASLCRHNAAPLPQAGVPAKKQAGLVLVNSSVDLGKVRLRKKYTAVFRVRNEGDKACVIQHAHPLCNCLSLEEVPHVVLPGDTASFKVAFLSTGKGFVRRSVQFRVKDNPATYLLSVQAQVE